MKQKLTFISIFFITILSFYTHHLFSANLPKSDIIFAYIPPSIHKCFTTIQKILEDNFIVENNDKNSFYDLCNVLEYDSKIIHYQTALTAVKDALDILKESSDLFLYRKKSQQDYQLLIDFLQDYQECLLNNESTVTVNSTGIKISQNLKNTKNGSYIINLSPQDATTLLTLFKQTLYRAPRLSNDEDLPPTNADFLHVLHVDSQSIKTKNLHVCDGAEINGTLAVCGEILLNSLDLEMELEDLISCCDNHESRLDILESEIDLLESCCDAQDSRLDILESEIDLLESCCDAQDSRLDILESEVDLLESCCDAQDSRLDIIESEIDILNSCCDTQDSRLDIIESEIDLLESCCDAQDSRLDIVDSEVDILESCCDALNSRVNVLESIVDTIETQDSRFDVIESQIELLESCCDAQDSRLDVIDTEIDILESCCDVQDSRLDILESEVDLLESCCDAQDSRLDIIDSEIDSLESCCDALNSRVDVLESIVDTIETQDSRFDVIESQIDLLESCCDAQDSRLDVIDTEIDILESCCDVQDSRLDILESEVDLLESCCDAQDSRLDIIDSEIDSLESCCDALNSRVDVLESIVDTIEAQDSRFDVIESQIDLLESCCDAQDSRLDIIESEIDSLDSRLDIFLTNELVFVSGAMDRRGSANPTTTFSNVYGTGNVNPVLRNWLMGPSTSGTPLQPMGIQFAIPRDFDSTGSVEVDVHVLIDDNSEPADQTASIRLRANFIHNNQQLGISAGGFPEDTQSADFTIVEPTLLNALNHQLVTITMTDSVVDTIEPQDWANIAINRAAPTVGTEYASNIYLSSVTFRYKRK